MGTFTNRELERTILNNEMLSKYYRGVYPSDCLPINIKLEPFTFIIVNTSGLNKDGKHWVCVFVNLDKSLTHFCSLGRLPKSTILAYLEARGRYHVTTRSYQSCTSRLCGLYCLFFAYLRCVGFSDIEIDNCFCKNCQSCNDKIVWRFCSDLLDIVQNNDV